MQVSLRSHKCEKSPKQSPSSSRETKLQTNSPLEKDFFEAPCNQKLGTTCNSNSAGIPPIEMTNSLSTVSHEQTPCQEPVHSSTIFLQPGAGAVLCPNSSNSHMQYASIVSVSVTLVY